MSMTKTASQVIVGTIDDLLSTLKPTKQAEALSEPGSQGGATTHPSKSVDDSLQTATEGSHSATNEKDVKKDQPLGVDNASEGSGGSQQDKQTNIGITSKPTGEDSAAETASAKAGKDDPGSSHPARTDNDSLDGMKYASTIERFRAFTKVAETKGNALTAQIAANADSAVKAATGRKPTTPAKTAAAPTQTVTPAAAAASGAALADNVSGDMDKQALDALIADELAATVATAEDSAVRAVDYLRKCAMQALAAQKKAARRKKAGEGDDSSDPSAEGSEEEAPPEEGGEGGGEDSGAGGDGMGGGNMGGGGMDAGGGGGQPGDAELMAALQGGGDMGAGDAMQGMAGGDAGGGLPGGGPGAGGGPMDMGGGGGDPMAAMGGGGEMPPGTDPGMGGGDMAGAGMGSGQLDPQTLQILMHVLQQAGINPQELEAGATAKAAQFAKTAFAAGLKSTWSPKNAAQKKQADEMLKHVLEMTGRSKRK